MLQLKQYRMLNPRIIFRYIQICSGPLPLAIDKRGSPNKHVHTQTPNPQRAHAHILNPSRLSSTASHSRRQREEITIKACKRSAGVFQLLHIEEDVGETWRDPLKQTLGRHNRHRKNRCGIASRCIKSWGSCSLRLVPVVPLVGLPANDCSLPAWPMCSKSRSRCNKFLANCAHRNCRDRSVGSEERWRKSKSFKVHQHIQDVYQNCRKGFRQFRQPLQPQATGAHWDVVGPSCGVTFRSDSHAKLILWIVDQNWTATRCCISRY